MIYKGLNEKYETIYGALCDKCPILVIRADGSLEIKTNDYGVLKDHMELKGWKIINGAGGEEHVCPDCEV